VQEACEYSIHIRNASHLNQTGTSARASQNAIDTVTLYMLPNRVMLNSSS